MNEVRFKTVWSEVWYYLFGKGQQPLGRFVGIVLFPLTILLYLVLVMLSYNESRMLDPRHRKVLVDNYCVSCKWQKMVNTERRCFHPLHEKINYVTGETENSGCACYTLRSRVPHCSNYEEINND